MKKISVIGNCQATGLANCLSLMLPNHIVEVKTPTADMSDVSAEDTILLQADSSINLTEKRIDDLSVIKWPNIIFSGFHPDIIRISHKVLSPTGGWHSSICMMAYKLGLTVDGTQSLFRKEVFESLGFFDHYNQSCALLTTHLDQLEFPGRHLVEKWGASGCFMHGVNHPKLKVLADIAASLIPKLQLDGNIELTNPEAFLMDNMLVSAIWPVFPPISTALGLGLSEYRFKAPNPTFWRAGRVYDLRTFIQASFSIYERAPQELLVNDRFDQPAYQHLMHFVEALTSIPKKASASPYADLPDYCYWRRAIERLPASKIDPVVVGKLKLTVLDRVATAGSCFAQHISHTLEKSGLNYFVAEPTPAGLTREEGLARNYGIFSARYGNIYTARQLLQLFVRAYGDFAPYDQAWVRYDGRLVDPFRPTIEPAGFARIEDIEKAKAEHLKAVRLMFETLDVFIFTLGLTEAWRSRVDGAVFPLAPGVAAGNMDEEYYEFINFGVSETVADMNTFIQKLRDINPHAKIILTVSPVPLIATYENRHVLLSTIYSKSVLRAAAEEVVCQNKDVVYFPSYEIITGAFNRGAYYEEDLRSIRPAGVDHVMTLFLHHYTDVPIADGVNLPIAREVEENMGLVCDEIWMDAPKEDDLRTDPEQQYGSSPN